MDPLVDRLESSGASLHYYPDLELTPRTLNPLRLAKHLRRSISAVRKIARSCTANEVQLVILNGENLLLGPLIGRLARVNTLCIIRGARFADLGLLASTYFALHSCNVARYLAVSHSVKSLLVKIGVPKHKIQVIHNGVNLKQFYPAPPPQGLQSDLGIPDHAQIIGAVGHLVPRKGIHHFIELFHLMAKERPQLHGLVLGDVPNGVDNAYKRLLLKRVKELGLTNQITFLGYRNEVAPFLRLMHVVVHPSETESFGRSIAEAMACARPVVAFRVAAVPELVDHRTTGLLAEPFNIGEMARLVFQLLDDTRLAAQLGRAARGRAVEAFDLERNVAATLDLAESLFATETEST